MVRQANILIKTTVERKWKDFPKISKCGCWGKLNCHTRWIATNKLMSFISRVRENRFLLFNYFSFCTRNKELHVPKSSPDTSKSFSNTTFVWIRINWEHSECTQSLYDWILALIYIRNLSVSYTATIIIILLHIDLPLYFSVVDWIGLVYGV